MLVMTRGPDSCIYAFPLPAWLYYMDQMLDLEIPTDERLKLMRGVLSRATNCSIDNQWRVKLPPDLVSYAKLDREAEIVGFHDRLEIWNPNIHSSYQEDESFDYDKVINNLFIDKMPGSGRPEKERD